MPVLLKGKPKQRNSSGDPEEFRATLGEHLDELRGRLVRSAVLVAAGWILGWFLEPYLYDRLIIMFLAAVKEGAPAGVSIDIKFMNVSDPFMLKLKLSFMIGLAVALPFVVLQIWKFVEPGLKPNEARPLRLMAPLSVMLFGIGAFFCWLVLPAAYKFFSGFLSDYSNTGIIQDPEKLIMFAVKMMAAFGLGFQLPLIVFILGRLSILTPETLSRYWRQATVFIFFASAIITPSQDIFSMLMMALPLSLLFMLSIYAVRLTTRGKTAHDPELDDLDY